MGDAGHNRFWDLPILDFLHAGTSMVAIFFVISGYVLSLKGFRCARKKDWEGLLESTASSIFRRGFRLFGPIVICLAVESIALRVGLFEQALSEMWQLEYERDHFPVRMDSWSEQFGLWWSVLLRLGNCWTWDLDYPKELDGNLWTIPVEFRSSMVLFIVLIGICKIDSSRRRRAIMFTIISSCVHYQRWEVVLFLSGMFLADIDTPEVEIKHEVPPERPTLKQELIWGTVVVVGIYLCSSPFAAPERAWGYISLTKVASFFYTEAHRFWQSIGAILLVSAARRSKGLRWILETQLVQYLGDISYALYLVHGPFIRGFAFMVVPFFWRYTNSSFGVDAAIAAGYLLFVPVVFALADACWRLVDTPCVKFARWLEARVFGN